MFNNHDVCGTVLSIHDLHGEVDVFPCPPALPEPHFQFTTSMGRSTRDRADQRQDRDLSIHDLHGEVDAS